MIPRRMVRRGFIYFSPKCYGVQIQQGKEGECVMSQDKKELQCYMVPTRKFERTQMISPAGILLFIVVLTGFIVSCPWDLKQSVISIDYASVFMDASNTIENPDEKLIEAACLENLFQTGTLQSGGYIQERPDGGYNAYFDGLTAGYYQLMTLEDGKEDFTAVRGLKKNGVFFQNHFVAVEGENHIIYANQNTLARSEFDFNWKEAVWDGEKYDYCQITSWLDLREGEQLSVRQAAVIAGLLSEHTLLGYQDGTAWFYLEGENEKMMLIRAEADSWEVAMENIEKPETCAMVAGGRYLLQDYEGKLFVISIPTGDGAVYPIEGENGEEAVQMFSYSCRQDAVAVYQCGDTTMQWMILRDNEVNSSEIQTHNYRSDVDQKIEGIAVTQSEEIDIVWHKLKNDYHWYKIKGVTA